MIRKRFIELTAQCCGEIGKIIYDIRALLTRKPEGPNSQYSFYLFRHCLTLLSYYNRL
jgi:hypothetical protein